MKEAEHYTKHYGSTHRPLRDDCELCRNEMDVDFLKQYARAHAEVRSL